MKKYDDDTLFDLYRWLYANDGEVLREYGTDYLVDGAKPTKNLRLGGTTVDYDVARLDWYDRDDNLIACTEIEVDELMAWREMMS